MPEHDAPALKVGRARTGVPKTALRALSLTGGGYRGLFTAQVLVELCELADSAGPLHKAFDVFSGTSIGGLMACALAVGVDPRRVLDAIDKHGKHVFPGKLQRTARRLMFGTLYDADNLGKAIDECLGAWSRRKLRDVPCGLLVPAVNWVTGQTECFMSAGLGKRVASDATLRDVCLATSAAPTYFDPHDIDGAPMLDGGLVANNPDVLLIVEVARRWPDGVGRLEMLSIGTAGIEAGGMTDDAAKTGAQWAPQIVNFMISVQERSAAAQAQRLLGKRYLRVNHAPTRGQAALGHMDVVNDTTRATLLATGKSTAQTAYAQHKAFVDRMVGGQRRAK